MSNPFAFLKRRDPVETIIILLGGLLVVVIAFFIARGDLDYYTEYLLTGGIFERKIEVKEVEVPFSSYFLCQMKSAPCLYMQQSKGYFRRRTAL